ncbi:chordin-like [Mytilus edulis]|uniref:chordin-like n=1 Tax=Mytilus edulis TaxID=6550 RepID=UPI0039F1383F
MFDLFREILLLAGFAHLVVAAEIRFSALRPEPEIKEKENYQPGCWLGKHHYKLMEKFSPALEPNGRLVCILCQCIPVTRKGIIQHYGKAKCVNIKDKCPLPNCHNPILLPGKCCKSCQGQVPFENQYVLLPQDINDHYESSVNSDKEAREEYKEQRYTALLVGKNVVGSPPLMTKAVAMVYVLVKKDATLQFSVRYAELQNPKQINVVDSNGNILLSHDFKQSRDRKFCGEWYNVPSYYLNYIAKKQLHLTITTKRYPRGEVAGIPEHDTSFDHGTFGALLISPIPRGIGAYVEFRYSYSSRRKVIDYLIYQDGFLDNKRRKLEYFVTIEKNTKIIHQDTRRIRYKSNKKANLNGSWKRPNKRERRLMTRRKLRLRLTSKGGTTMIGDITPVLTCQIFQAVLSSSEALTDSVHPLTSVGSAVFQLHDNGQIAYMIRLYSMKQNLVSLTLESTPTRRRRRRVIQDLTKTFRYNTSSDNGFAVGIFKKPTAKDLTMFLTGKLYINVGTSYRQISALRGKIERTEHDSTIDILRNAPFILMAQPQTQSTGVAGHAWLAVTDKCVLHYQILLSGLRDHTTITALITGKYDSAPSYSGNAIYTIIITDFKNGIASGRISDISREVFHSLDRGTSFMQIDVVGVTKGSIYSNLSIVNDCWQKTSGNNYNMLLDEGYKVPVGNPITSCNYEGRIYNDGSTWIPVGNDSCYTCTCQQQKILCDVVVCPGLKCEYKVKVPGLCCPKCAEKPDKSRLPFTSQNNTHTEGSCYYDGDKRWHAAGTKWHPYVPPFGYVTCAVCSCMTDGSYDCKRSPCPALNCSKSEAVRIKANDCCQVCPDKQTLVIANSESQADHAVASKEKSCKFGDEVFPHRAKWHPKLSDNEEVACVKCRCKNGKVKCRRKKCTPDDCRRTKNKNVEKCCQCPGSHRKSRGRSKSSR